MGMIVNKKKDLTEGMPFRKWFWGQMSNIMITAFAVVFMICLIIYRDQFDTVGQFWIFECGVLAWWVLVLVLSYRNYKQLQKGISK